jgi:hypothetical protein
MAIDDTDKVNKWKWCLETLKVRINFHGKSHSKTNCNFLTVVSAMEWMESQHAKT